MGLRVSRHRRLRVRGDAERGRWSLCGRARSHNLAGVIPALEGWSTTGQQVFRPVKSTSRMVNAD